MGEHPKDASSIAWNNLRIFSYLFDYHRLNKKYSTQSIAFFLQFIVESH